jgi:hypothetical protein
MFACVRDLTCNIVATTKTNSLRLLAAYHKGCKSTACSLQYFFATQRHVCVFSTMGFLATAQRLPHERCHMLNCYTAQQHCCRSPALPHHRCTGFSKKTVCHYLLNLCDACALAAVGAHLAIA